MPYQNETISVLPQPTVIILRASDHITSSQQRSVLSEDYQRLGCFQGQTVYSEADLTKGHVFSKRQPVCLSPLKKILSLELIHWTVWAEYFKQQQSAKSKAKNLFLREPGKRQRAKVNAADYCKLQRIQDNCFRDS